MILNGHPTLFLFTMQFQVDLCMDFFRESTNCACEHNVITCCVLISNIHIQRARVLAYSMSNSSIISECRVTAFQITQNWRIFK